MEILPTEIHRLDGTVLGRNSCHRVCLLHSSLCRKANIQPIGRIDSTLGDGNERNSPTPASTPAISSPIPTPTFAHPTPTPTISSGQPQPLQPQPFYPPPQPQPSYGQNQSAPFYPQPQPVHPQPQASGSNIHTATNSPGAGSNLPSAKRRRASLARGSESDGLTDSIQLIAKVFKDKVDIMKTIVIGVDPDVTDLEKAYELLGRLEWITEESDQYVHCMKVLHDKLNRCNIHQSHI